MIRIFAAIFFIAFLAGCKKEKLNIPFRYIDTGTDHDIHHFTHIGGDTLVLCGGNSNSGIIMKSQDNGNTWRILSKFDSKIYSVYFLNSLVGFAGGDSSRIFKTIDGGSTWTLFIDYAGVPELYQVPLRQFAFADSVNGFVCGGRGFGKGIIYSTNDCGSNWTKTLADHELRSVSVAKGSYNQNAFCVGYGAFYQSTIFNGWHLIDEANKNFYTGVEYESIPFTCTFDGEIYRHEGGSWKRKFKWADNISSTAHFTCMDNYGNTLITTGLNGVSAFSLDGGNQFESGVCFDGNRINAVLLTGLTSGLAGGNNGKLFAFELQ